ncbi:GyrI-like domain-containing protein [Niveibacterium sp. SC-1]|uniref:AraC family transcriptional regulator n=1 Tax=Niveibacterium sp. SC-1 TaxID=3135646 RepID=UPI00311F638E
MDNRLPASHCARVDRVLDHIAANLDAPLALQDLAAIAHFSPFHFHRMFVAHTGETVQECVRRLRLERAAHALLQPEAGSMLELAVANGFSSGEAFARAFKRHFGVTPTAWRAGRHREWRATHAPEPEAFTLGAVSLCIEAPRRIAYMRHIGSYGRAVNRFWARFERWVAEHAPAGALHIGVGLDDEGVTPANQCRYDAAVEVDEAFVADRQVSLRWLEGGLYAQVLFEGDPDDILRAWRSFYRDWLPSSGYTVDDRPAFETYPFWAGVENEVFRCILHFPLRPLPRR